MPEARGGFQEYKGQAPPKTTKEPPAKKATKEELKVSEAKPAQAFEYKEHKTMSNLRLVTLSNKGVQLYQLKTNAPDQLE